MKPLFGVHPSAPYDNNNSQYPSVVPQSHAPYGDYEPDQGSQTHLPYGSEHSSHSGLPFDPERGSQSRLPYDREDPTIPPYERSSPFNPDYGDGGPQEVPHLRAPPEDPYASDGRGRSPSVDSNTRGMPHLVLYTAGINPVPIPVTGNGLWKWSLKK